MEFHDGVFSERGQFIEIPRCAAIRWHRSADNHSAPNIQRLQDRGDGQTQGWKSNADQLEGRFGRIKQRPEVIENCFLAALAAKASRGADLLKRGMIIRREKKCEMLLPQ